MRGRDKGKRKETDTVLESRNSGPCVTALFS